MACYGFFVSAPLGHLLVGRLQKAFAGQTGTKAKILQILASNLITAPVQITGESCFLRDAESSVHTSDGTAYLACNAIINGARTWKQVAAVVKGGFWDVMKVCKHMVTAKGWYNSNLIHPPDHLDNFTDQHCDCSELSFS